MLSFFKLAKKMPMCETETFMSLLLSRTPLKKWVDGTHSTVILSMVEVF